MLRRWARGLLATFIVVFVVASVVGSAAAPLADVLSSPSISAEVGGLRIVIGI